jgi:Flp pilus assembly protein TadD
MTALRNRDYRSEVALWESTVQSAPAKARPHHNLGCAYALAGRYDDAKRELEAALALRPDYPRARRNLAAIVAAR